MLGIKKERRFLTFWTFSSFLFLRPVMSPVLFLVSSIFLHVFISSCFKRAIRLASNWASRSILQVKIKVSKMISNAVIGLVRISNQMLELIESLSMKNDLLFSSLFNFRQTLKVCLISSLIVGLSVGLSLLCRFATFHFLFVKILNYNLSIKFFYFET